MALLLLGLDLCRGLWDRRWRGTAAREPVNQERGEGRSQDLEADEAVGYLVRVKAQAQVDVVVGNQAGLLRQVVEYREESLDDLVDELNELDI